MLNGEEAEGVAQMEVGFILYSGSQGEAALPVGPPFPWDDVTIGSYRCDAFRGGVHLGEVPCRTSGLTVPGPNTIFETWMEEIFTMCGDARVSEFAAKSLPSDEF